VAGEAIFGARDDALGMEYWSEGLKRNSADLDYGPGTPVVWCMSLSGHETASLRQPTGSDK
jgi:hypothetical protein